MNPLFLNITKNSTSEVAVLKLRELLRVQYDKDLSEKNYKDICDLSILINVLLAKEGQKGKKYYYTLFGELCINELTTARLEKMLLGANDCLGALKKQGKSINLKKRLKKEQAAGLKKMLLAELKKRGQK